MTLVGVDLHTREQSVAVLDTATGEVQELRLRMTATPWSDSMVLWNRP